MSEGTLSDVVALLPRLREIFLIVQGLVVQN